MSGSIVVERPVSLSCRRRDVSALFGKAQWSPAAALIYWYVEIIASLCPSGFLCTNTLPCPDEVVSRVQIAQEILHGFVLQVLSRF